MPTKPKLVMPNEEEDAAINRGIAGDPDTFEVPPEDFSKMMRLGKRGMPKDEFPVQPPSLR